MNLAKVVFICGSEPSLLCSMPSSLWAFPRTSSPWVPTLKQEASKCQAAAISIRLNDLQEAPKNRLEVNASLLPLKRSDPRLQSFQVLSSMGSMLKKSGMTTCPATSMYACTAWYMVGTIQNHRNHFPSSGLWCLEALVNFVQSRAARWIFPKLLILKALGPLTCSKQFPLLCICQCFSNQKFRFDILHPLNLHFLFMLCFKGRFLISSS